MEMDGKFWNLKQIQDIRVKEIKAKRRWMFIQASQLTKCPIVSLSFFSISPTVTANNHHELQAA